MTTEESSRSSVSLSVTNPSLFLVTVFSILGTIHSITPTTGLTHYLPTTSKMTRFRPCIDLHAGQVKQIVGGTLTTNTSELKTNYVSSHPASYYANLYKEADSFGPHVIMLGPGNEDAAYEALAAWPGMLQVGGGITDKNARSWIEKGAGKVSDVSFCFFDIPS